MPDRGVNCGVNGVPPVWIGAFGRLLGAEGVGYVEYDAKIPVPKGPGGVRGVWYETVVLRS